MVRLTRFARSWRNSRGVGADKQEQTHEVKLTAGTTVVIEMRSKDFDTLLRLEDAKGTKLVENDDIDLAANDLDSRLLFTPRQDGMYSVVATSFQRRGRGQYAIIIRAYVGKDNNRRNEPVGCIEGINPESERQERCFAPLTRTASLRLVEDWRMAQGGSAGKLHSTPPPVSSYRGETFGPPVELIAS